MNLKISITIGLIAISILGASMFFVENKSSIYIELYQKYKAPMQDHGRIAKEVMHLDIEPLQGNQTFTGLVSEITMIDDNSIRVKFEGGRTLPPWGYFPPFVHEEIYHAGDSFVTLCVKHDNSTHFGIFEYNDTINKNGKEWVILIHADATTQKYLPCDFPQVIMHTRNTFSLGSMIDKKQFEWSINSFNEKNPNKTDSHSSTN